MSIGKQGKFDFKLGGAGWKEGLARLWRTGLGGWNRFYARRRFLVGTVSFLLLLAIGWGIGRQISPAPPAHPLVVQEASGSAGGETADLATLVRQLQADLSALRTQFAEEGTGSTAVAAEPAPTYTPLRLIPPLTGRVSRQSGWEKKAGEWRYHSGVDLSVPPGTAVVAVAAGRVGVIKTDPALGTIVAVDHGNDWRSLYGHLTRIQVSVGQEVAQGALLGYSSHASCGPEPGIHFNLYHQENPVDPVTMLNLAQD